jgi:type VI secretion system protein VasI
MHGNYTESNRFGDEGAVRMVATVVALAVVVLSAGTLSAQEQAENQNCEDLLGRLEKIHQTDDPLARLEAFDELAASLFGVRERTPETGSGENEHAEENLGDWVSWVDSDPITDEKQFFAVLEAESGLNEFGTRPSLIIRRTGSTDEVYVTWSDYFAEDWARVTHRTDSAEPQSLSWPVSTDNDATFYPGDATAFVKRIMDAERLVLRTTPYDSSPITAIFRPEGLREIAGEHPELLADWLE